MTGSGQIDGLAALTDKLAIKRSGWHRVEGPDGVALFPSVPRHAADSKEQLKLEREWEQKALAMHEAQEPVWLDAKPEENTLAARKRIMRGD